MAATVAGELSPSYLAGLFDAEGSVSILRCARKDMTHPKYELRLCLANTHAGVLEAVRDQCGGYLHWKENRARGWRRAGFLYLGNAVAVRFLQRVGGVLVVKRERARLGVEFFGGGSKCVGKRFVEEGEWARRELLRERVLALNAAGESGLVTGRCDVDYMAGFFDGEGCVGICRSVGGKGSVNPTHRLTVTIVNCDRRPLEMMQRAFGGSLHVVRHSVESGWRDSYRLCLSSRAAGAFLAAIVGRVIVKRDVVAAGLEFQSGVSMRGRYTLPREELKRRDALRARIAQTNQGGVL